MKKVTNGQIARIISRAKKYLWDGKGLRWDMAESREYICHAIDDAKGVNHAAAYKAIDIIEKRLGCKTFDDWLSCQPGVDYHDMTTERVQTHRLAWMDLLITEFSTNSRAVYLTTREKDAKKALDACRMMKEAMKKSQSEIKKISKVFDELGGDLEVLRNNVAQVLSNIEDVIRDEFEID